MTTVAKSQSRAQQPLAQEGGHRGVNVLNYGFVTIIAIGGVLEESVKPLESPWKVKEVGEPCGQSSGSMPRARLI